jgi:hypothetical protein
MDNKKAMIERLESLKSIDNKLRNCVIDYAIDECDNYDTIKDWFEDLGTHGCISGMIGSLIYYSDTHKFFDTYYEDIMDLIVEFRSEAGVMPDFNSDLKNDYAWFAFEETAYRLYDELGFND